MTSRSSSTSRTPIILLTMSLAVLLLIIARPAAAQVPTFGVRAGATFPTGDVQDELETGYHVGVSVGFAPILLPISLRSWS